MSRAPSEADSEDEPEFQAAVAEVQKSWEVAALAQFYRTIGPYIPRAICPSSDLLEYELVKGVEEYLVGLMLPLLGLGEDDNSEMCWAKVSELRERGALDVVEGLDTSKPIGTFQDLAPVQRGKLLYAIAEASLDIFDTRGVIDVNEANAMRGDRLGVDEKNRVYWTLGDHRLYREAGPPPPPPPPPAPPAKGCAGA